MDNVLLEKIKAFSGADKNAEEIFDLDETRLDFYIEEYYKSMESWIRKKYDIPKRIPCDVEQILVELTSNLLKSHATRQNLAVISHEDYDFEESANSIFTEDLEKRLKPYTRKSRVHMFTI